MAKTENIHYSNGVNIVIAKTNASEEGLVNVELHAVFT